MYGSEDLNLPFKGSGGSDNQDTEEANLFPHQNLHPMRSELVEYPHPAHRSGSPDTESMFARFMTDKQPLEQRRSQLLMPLMAEEATRSERELEHSSSNLRMLFQSPQQHPPQLQTLNSESPYSVTTAEVEEEEGEEEETRRGVAIGGRRGLSSNLIRQRSSPAGFFSPLKVDNGE